MATPTSISYFAPVSTRPVESCEEHYTDRHTVWARRMLRAEPAYEAYHTARALARFDGHAFAATPTRWRYVLLRRRRGLSAALSPESEQYIAENHRLFLQDWHGFAAEQEVVLDARSGQTTYESYLLEIGAAPAWRSVVTGLLDHAGDAYGLRAILVDEVDAEFAAAPVDRPGQRPDRTPLAATGTAAFVHLLFDQHEWATEWFADRPVVSGEVPTLLHHVELRCGFDER